VKTSSTGIIRRYAIAAIICGIGTGALSGESDRSLTAHLDFQESGGLYFIDLANPTAEFLCVDASQFDTSRPTLGMKTATGGTVQSKSFTDPAFSSDLGFNFNESYVFIKPGSTHRVYLNMSNYKLAPGRYTLSGLISYYKCRDIINKSRLTEKRDIKSSTLRLDESLEYRSAH
jgi:hypothetical protein